MATEINFRVRALYYMALSDFFWQYHPDPIASHYLIIMKNNISDTYKKLGSISHSTDAEELAHDKKLKKIVINKLVKDIKYDSMVNSLFRQKVI